MINLYGTVINESEIIGVGPLMVKKPTDPTIAQLYKELAYYFQVYTHNYHFVITTDWLSFADENVKAASKQAYAAIVQAQKDLKACLVSGCFTGMRLPTDND